MSATFMGIKTSRIALHVLFWIVVFVVFTIIYAIKSSYYVAAHNNLFYIVVYMAYFYSIAYWLIPAYLLRGSYTKLISYFLMLVFVSALLCRVIDILVVLPYLIHHTKTVDWMYHEEYGYTFWHNLTIPLNFTYSLRMANEVVWFAVGIKLFKLWFERKQAALKAELKGLKAQIHPHFLFNTLNNLYALTLNNSPKAPGVVLGLSDMLRYMLYECNADKVSLNKEVLMLQHYIGLEKIRYEDRLDLNFTINGELDDKLIAPLMLLPLVENAFKHGTSEKVGAAWINISLEVAGKQLKFKISNSRPDAVEGEEDKYRGNIGLQNIKQRLELLYPTTHQLKIMDEEEAFLAVLELELEVAQLKPVEQPVTA